LPAILKVAVVHLQSVVFADGSVHSIHLSDTTCEIELSFILSLELVPWQVTVKIMVNYSSCSSVFSSDRWNISQCNRSWKGV